MHISVTAFVAALALGGQAAEAPPAACPAGTVAAESCDHAINTKGTGVAGRCAASAGDGQTGEAAGTAEAERTALAIKTKGTSAQRTDMAIKTKGTGAQRTDMAIKTKGTGAQRSADGAELAINCKGTSVK